MLSLRLLLLVYISFILTSCGASKDPSIYPNYYELKGSDNLFSIWSNDQLENILSYYDDTFTSIDGFESWEKINVNNGNGLVNAKLFIHNERIIYIQIISIEELNNYITVVKMNQM